MKKISLFISSLLLFTSCANNSKNYHQQTYMEAATAWVQNAAEVRALSYQAFNLAKLQLDKDLRKRSRKKRAIVVDVDETIVDNSPYQAKNVLENRSYEKKSWNEWIDMADAKALPGAVEFLKYADRKGAEVFYITNRKIRGLDATYKNLVKLGLPVKRKNLFLKTTTSSKQARRNVVLKKHRIVLLMGDTLADFHEAFEELNIKDRFQAVERFKNDFGKKFIVLPNPMYGDWEWAMYNYDYSLKHEEKRALRLKRLYPSH
jgi:5'-nucleotidase (lipoprotein e(P4) family)